MTTDEEIILTKFKDFDKGLLSPAEYLNMVSSRKNKSSHSLITKGYVEEVPTQVNGEVHNFYRLTDKANLYFLPFWKKSYIYIRKDIRTVLVAIIAAIGTTVAVNLIKSWPT